MLVAVAQITGNVAIVTAIVAMLVANIAQNTCYINVVKKQLGINRTFWACTFSL